MTDVLLTQQLADLLGPDAVLPAEGYAIDQAVPQAVARPADREGVARVVRWAAERDLALAPRGGSVLTGLGNTPARVDLALDLTRLDRVLDYQPADLTATVEAGVTLAVLQNTLAQGSKLVPLEAPLAHRTTIGGILAAGAGGPLRHSYGLPRDWLIGISVVGADGEETKAGGRVVKNVTGYDLNKLYTGSLGTLGVIVEASFKLAPLPDAWAGLVTHFPSVQAGVQAARSLVAQVYAPQGVQVINRQVARRLGLDMPSGAAACLVAFLYGRPRAVARRRDDAFRLLQSSGAAAPDELNSVASQDLLRQLTDLGWADADLPTLALKVNLPPTQVGQLLADLGNAGDTGEAAGIMADPGFGTVRLLRWPDATATDPAAAVVEIKAARAAARVLGGTVVVERCPLPVKEAIDVWGGEELGQEMAIMRRIKANFDPYGILNPGRFIGRL